jgi:excisionase family DNA binding protein
MSSKNKGSKNNRFGPGNLNRRAHDGSKLYLTIEEAAVHFNIGKATVLEWVKLGVVPHYTLGGRVYFHKDEVAAYWAMFAPERRY